MRFGFPVPDSCSTPKSESQSQNLLNSLSFDAKIHNNQFNETTSVYPQPIRKRRTSTAIVEDKCRQKVGKLHHHRHNHNQHRNQKEIFVRYIYNRLQRLMITISNKGQRNILCHKKLAQFPINYHHHRHLVIISGINISSSFCAAERATKTYVYFYFSCLNY